MLNCVLDALAQFSSLVGLAVLILLIIMSILVVPLGVIAALFLREFVGDAKWVHLDIAGPARASAEVQTLLEADVPADQAVDPEKLDVTRQILESRANGLGVSEVVMQTAGDRRIVAEFPGINNPEEVVASLQETGLLEFVDTGTTRPAEGEILQTDYGADPNATPQPTDGTQPPVYHTIMTGAGLESVAVTRSQLGQYEIAFTLKSEEVGPLEMY